MQRHVTSPPQCSAITAARSSAIATTTGERAIGSDASSVTRSSDARSRASLTRCALRSNVSQPS
jgi:hypothetical protein